MSSPKQITKFGIVVGVISLLGLIVGFFVSYGPAILGWWPVAGLVLALALFGLAIVRGAYLTAQRRVELVDMLNDCYQGNEKKEDIREFTTELN